MTKTVDLRGIICEEATVMVNTDEKKIEVTTKTELVYPEKLIAIMVAERSVGIELVGYDYYENGEKLGVANPEKKQS